MTVLKNMMQKTDCSIFMLKIFYAIRVCLNCGKTKKLQVSLLSNNIFLIKLDRTLFLNQIALVNALFKHQIATPILQFHLQFNLYQKCISRFRLSTHQLAKETSQFSNINGQGRKSFLCSYYIDDEFHFTLICPVCEVYRQEYIKPYC